MGENVNHIIIVAHLYRKLTGKLWTKIGNNNDWIPKLFTVNDFLCAMLFHAAKNICLNSSETTVQIFVRHFFYERVVDVCNKLSDDTDIGSHVAFKRFV